MGNVSVAFWRTEAAFCGAHRPVRAISVFLRVAPLRYRYGIGMTKRSVPPQGNAINYLILLRKLERANGFEPSTLTLARLCSTPELRPHSKFEDGGYGP